MINILKKSEILTIIVLFLLFSSVAIAETNGVEEYNVANRYVVDKKYTLAIKYYKLSAQKGNANAMYMLGLIYDKNIIVPRNEEESFRWYKKAVDAGSLEALVPLARKYELGSGTQKNKKLVFQLYKKAADNGFTKAYDEVGYAYYFGTIIKRDTQEALKWLIKAYEANIKNNEEYAASGNASSIGTLYYYGDGIPKDIVKALYWYKISVDLDTINPMPSYNLGNFYYERKEYKEALKYYKISSQKLDGHNVPATVAVGNMYFLGEGLEEADYLLASKYYQKAVDKYTPHSQHKKDIKLAMLQLGTIYSKGGNGIEKNINTANIWFERASSLGDSSGK